MSRPTYYTKTWEDKTKYPDISVWITGEEGSKTFNCKLCKKPKDLQLGNMGITALRSHEQTDKHKKFIEQFKTQKPLEKSFFPKTKTVQKTLPTPSAQVKKTEILMAIQSVMSHISHRTMEEFAEMLEIYCPDSTVPKDMKLGRTKIGYLIQFGLAPYYTALIFSSLLPKVGTAPRFTSCFDEAFNRISKRKQMDVHIIYFDDEKMQVTRNYIGSHFMGHATAEDTYRSLKEVHRELDLSHNLVQLSMDGPNVNLKTLEIVEENRKIEDPNCPKMINIGSCGLHVVHGAFATGQKATDWSLDKFLRSIFSIFKVRALKIF